MNMYMCACVCIVNENTFTLTFALKTLFGLFSCAVRQSRKKELQSVRHDLSIQTLMNRLGLHNPLRSPED